MTWYITVYTPLPNFEIVEEETYLEVEERRYDPGSYQFAEGTQGTFVITAKNVGDGDGECIAWVFDYDTDEVLAESDPAWIPVRGTYTFSLTVTFDKNRTLKVAVLRRDPDYPDLWQITDTYG